MNAWLVPAVIFVVVVLASWLGLRWIRSEHLETLRAVPLFSGLSDRDLMNVLRSTHGEEFPRGASIIREGDRGKGFFVLTRGSATVTIEGELVATLGPGSYFGEMAVLDDAPRAATITSTGSAFALELGPAALFRLVDQNSSIARSLEDELRRRLAEAGDPVEPAEHVDRARLTELSSRLRRLQHPDWVVSEARRHGLRLSGLFARGD